MANVLGVLHVIASFVMLVALMDAAAALALGSAAMALVALARRVGMPLSMLLAMANTAAMLALLGLALNALGPGGVVFRLLAHVFSGFIDAAGRAMLRVMLLVVTMHRSAPSLGGVLIHTKQALIDEHVDRSWGLTENQTVRARGGRGGIGPANIASGPGGRRRDVGGYITGGGGDQGGI